MGYYRADISISIDNIEGQWVSGKKYILIFIRSNECWREIYLVLFKYEIIYASVKIAHCVMLYDNI